jgi:hypothetical protein
MNRLIALLTAVVAIALGGASIAFAASPSSTHGSLVSTAAHATYASGHDHGAAVSSVANAHGVATSTAAKAKHDATDTSTDTTTPTSDASRPQNHGFFVSTVAKDHTATGKAHGAAVSAVAKSDQGKSSHSGH